VAFPEVSTSQDLQFFGHTKHTATEDEG